METQGSGAPGPMSGNPTHSVIQYTDENKPQNHQYALVITNIIIYKNTNLTE